MATTKPRIPLAAAAAIGLYMAGHEKVRSVLNAAKVVSMLWSIAFCQHRIGHYPTQAEYAEYWGITDRTAQREWKLFKEVFPDEDSPERLARWLLSEMSSKIQDESSASSALAVYAPPDLALAA